MIGHLVPNFSSAKNAGDFYWSAPNLPTTERRLSFICPCGCGALAGVRVIQSTSRVEGFWEWDGNLEKPTISPSIKITNHWHGYLTKGEFIPA
jgi:hypothetical protein